VASSDEPNSNTGCSPKQSATRPDHSFGHLPAASGARWHDGVPVTAADVDLHLRDLKGQRPAIGVLLQERPSGRKETGRAGDHLHLLADRKPRAAADRRAVARVCRRHWWQGAGPTGGQRDVTQTTLEPPLGSGPYRLRASRPAHRRL
jgi:microcin C transport system substrate-binding protein